MPQDDIIDTMTTRATDRAQRFGLDFTARSPRPVILPRSSFFVILAKDTDKIQSIGVLGSGHHAQLLPWSRGAGFEGVIWVFEGQHHIDRLPQKLPPPG